MIAKAIARVRRQLSPDIVSGLDKTRERLLGVCSFVGVDPGGAGSPELFTSSQLFIDRGAASTQLPVCGE